MKEGLRAIVVGLLALTLCAGTASATEKWVDQASGSDANDGNTELTAYATLQFAIDNSFSGTVVTRSLIHVKDGTYETTGQTNQGADATAILIQNLDYLTIQAVPGHNPKVMPGTVADIVSISVENCDHLIIDNIDSDQTIAQFDNWHVWDSDDLTLRNSTFEGGEDGIDFNTALTTALIEHNTFMDITTGSGDEVLDFTGGPCTDVVIQDNLFDYNYRQMTLEGGDDTFFTIRRNVMDGTNSEEAIRLIGASDILVENNVLMNNMQQGIYVDLGCSNITVQHNTFFNNDQEAGPNGELRIKPDPTAANITVKNNIIYGNGSNPPFESVAAGWAGEDYNLIFNDNGSFDAFAGANTITGADPYFVSAVAGSEDLDLLDSSIAIGAGAGLGVLTDIDGEARGTPPDIGAYENAFDSPQVSTVWVDDDYFDGGANDGHTWSYDAFSTIQAGIDFVSGSTVYVAPGTYVEAILIDRPMSVLGATAGTNKNGYTVPVGYAWDDAVESIIQHPNPTSAYNAIVDIYDTDDVTFKGFVVEELSAVGNLNTSLVRVYAVTHAIDNIIVENNVIGPNTNTVSQDGTHGRMGLYLVNHPYSDQGITNSSFSHNKVFDTKGNGDNIFLWTSYYAYGAPGPASMAGTVIDDNEIYGSHRAGIETAGGYSDLTISNNDIYGNSGLPGDVTAKLKYGHGILLIRGSSDKVSNPLTAFGPVDLVITGNNIYDNEKSGIYTGPKNDGIYITENLIHDNGWNGVIVDLAGNYWNPQFESPPVSEQYACYDCSQDVFANDNMIWNNALAAMPASDYGVAVNGTPTNGFVLDAEWNWWGAPSGPYHPTVNPSGTGEKVTDYVDIDPYRSGNIVCDADPEYLSVASPTKTVDVNYLGGGGGLMYGYSLVFTWNGAIASTAPGSVTQGTLLSDAGGTFFFARSTGVNEITVDCMLLGAEPGVTGPGTMFSIAFTGELVGTSAIDITVDRVRDTNNNTLSGFFEDDGELIVDVSDPTVADVLITNDTLTHTNDYIKNTDQGTVTANVSDDDPGFGLADIVADLTGLGGGAAVNPDTYADPVATWTLASVTCVPSDGVVTVTVTATDAMANTANANDTIIADNTAPTAVTGFDASPANEECDLSWTNGTDTYFAGVVVRRDAVGGEYPQYPWFVANWPSVDTAYPGSELLGTNVYDGAGTSVTDAVVARNIYYYQAFCYDEARNYGPAVSTARDLSTNYWLGDVSHVWGSWGYDGLVDANDILKLSDSYGTTNPVSYPGDAECDVGPTVHPDWNRLGLPKPDDVVEFEDAMIFAMNYGVGGSVPAGGVQPGAAGADSERAGDGRERDRGSPEVGGQLGRGEGRERRGGVRLERTRVRVCSPERRHVLASCRRVLLERHPGKPRAS